MFVHNLKMNLS